MVLRALLGSVERIFGNLQDDELAYRVDSPSSRLQGPSAVLSNGDPWTLLKSARNLAFDGNYYEAGQKYKLASLMFADSETSQIQSAEDFLQETFVPDDILQPRPIGDFLHLGDGSPADLRNFMPLRIPTYRAVESSEK